MPWWNTPPEVAAPPVTLERVCAALRRLGLDPVVRDGRTQVVLYRYPCTLRLLSPAPAGTEQAAPPAPDQSVSGPVSTQADKAALDRPDAGSTQALQRPAPAGPAASGQTVPDQSVAVPAPAPQAPAPGPEAPAGTDQSVPPAPDRLTGALVPEPAQVRLLMESRYTVGLTQEAAARLAAHLLEKNSGRVSPTLLTAPGLAGADVVGRAWCTVPAGLSDPQLRTTLRVWCESTLHALDELSETQGLPLPPDPTGPASPGPTDPTPTTDPAPTDPAPAAPTV